MKARGVTISEKVVRRLMKEERLRPYVPKKARRYNSYKGEISPEVPNVLERDFHAPSPNEKWLADTTEFSLQDGKVYLVVSWTIGTSPLAELVKNYSPKAQVTSRPEAGPAGFVHVAENRPAGASGPRFRINYHGAEIETDGKRLHNRFHKTNSKRLRQTVFLLDETKNEVAS